MMGLFIGSERKTIQISSLFIAFLLVATGLVSTFPMQSAQAALYSSLKNVSDNTSVSHSGVVASYGSNVFVAWSDNAPSVSNIFVSKSTNGGSTFGDPIQVSNTQNGAYSPTIFAVGSYVYIAWTQITIEETRQIMFARSADSGLTYTNPKVVSQVGPSSNDLFPSIAAAGSSVYLSWVNSTETFGQLPFNGSSVYFAKSQDYGINFSNPVSLTGPSDEAVSAFAPQVAVSGKSVYVTWTGEDANGLGVKLAVSTNGGSSFGAYRHLATSNYASSPSGLAIAATGKTVYISYLNNTSSVGDRCAAKATSDNFGFVHATALNCDSGALDSFGSTHGSGPYTVAIIKSTDGGKSFGEAKTIQTIALGTSGSVRLTLSTTNAGKNVFVVYADTHPDANNERIFDVFITTSKNSGSSFSSPLNLSNDGVSLNPAVAAYGSTVFIVWQSGQTSMFTPDVVFTRST